MQTCIQCDNIINNKMVTDNSKATWLLTTMNITSQDMFDRDFNELREELQTEVLVEMIANRDFKGL